MQRLETRQGVGAGVLGFQRVAQGLQALLDQREVRVHFVHRRLRRRGRGVQDVGGFPAGGEVALGRELAVQRIQGQQLAYAGLLAVDHAELVAVVRADQPQAARQRQHEQQKQDLEFACKAKAPKQGNTR